MTKHKIFWFYVLCLSMQNSFRLFLELNEWSKATASAVSCQRQTELSCIHYGNYEVFHEMNAQHEEQLRKLL